MLNHIWFALIAIGILTAAGRDIYDSVNDTYASNAEWELRGAPFDTRGADGTWSATVRLQAADLRAHFARATWPDSGFASAAVFSMRTDGTGTTALHLPGDTPPALHAIAEAQGDAASLRATVRRSWQGSSWRWTLAFEPVRLVWMRRITNAAFDAAGTAVQIAIGLIGIMALWLGVMKVAEAAGLISRLARLVRPVTVRLFPDIPHDHPAVAAMLMNISANMLGLGNAATPFGLKAMEELNKVNTHAGTASNAMCTFLALNTSCVTLVPATAIAVRAAAGSSDPAIIIGTSFLASLTATLSAIGMARLLQGRRMFRIRTEEAA